MHQKILGLAIAAIATTQLLSGHASANDRTEFPGRRQGGGTRVRIEQVQVVRNNDPGRFPGGTSGGGGRFADEASDPDQ